MGNYFSNQNNSLASVVKGTKKELFVFVIDQSGSMESNDYKSTVSDQIVLPFVKEQIEKSGGPVEVDVHTFNAKHYHPVVFQSTDDAESLRPSLPTKAEGMTRYYETMLEVLQTVRDHVVKNGPYGIVSIQVFTDGANNILTNPYAESIMNAALDEARKGGWIFTFTGIERNPSMDTKSARLHECCMVSRNDFGSSRTLTSTRVQLERNQLTE